MGKSKTYEEFVEKFKPKKTTDDCMTPPENEAVDELRARKVKELPKYEYPDHVITSARMQYYASHGVTLKIKRRDCTFIRALDVQRKYKKAVFGGGLLLSDKAAAERAAAERAAAVVWELSDRGKEIVRGLG